MYTSDKLPRKELKIAQINICRNNILAISETHLDNSFDGRAVLIQGVAIYTNISFHYHGHSNGVCPSFAAITASTLLGRLFTRCWQHCCGDLLPFSHKSIIADRR
jgi:hypothetical protein